VIDIDAALTALTTHDKCALLEGASTWRSRAFPDAGVPAIKVSDGPNGIRGEGHGNTATAGVVVPAGITLGASWDPDLLREVGELLGRESIRKGSHVLLGPTVNLHRTPLGGRTFECYSEDPQLTALLAGAYVRGVQSHDVAVTVKHFVCNDTEIERMSVDVQVDERTLRELYLRPFEHIVKHADPWGIMSAYNRLNGEHCAENRRLLTDILRDEWGFDGFVVSDWFGAHHTAPSAHAGLNLEMPGPGHVFGAPLETAVEAGDVPIEQVDRLVRDMLVLANRVRADERSDDRPEESVDDPAERALTRRAAVGGTVLLRNSPNAAGDVVLPIAPASLRSIAVLGPNAVVDRSMGGGSASLASLSHRTLLDAITDRVGPGTDVDAVVAWEPGVRIDRLTPVAVRSQLNQPNGEPGLRVSYLNGTDWDAPAIAETTTATSMLRFFGSTPDGIDARAFCARVEGTFTPEADGPHVVGIVTTGPVTLSVDGATIIDDSNGELPRSDEFFGFGSIEVTATIDCTAGVPVSIQAKWASTAGNGFAALRIGFRSPEPVDLMDRAIAAAAAADVAVVVVGTNDEWETEGADRTTMDLPGRQNELVRRAVAANPRTVVVVNAGSPVTMDWAADEADSAPAVVTSFFAGQEQAEAMVDVLLGDADPGGRLPLTIPVRLVDHPAYLHHQPDHDSVGRSSQRYGEGLFMGYRHYDAASVAPRFAFGHGLSYGEASWGEALVSQADDVIHVAVLLTNDGDRDATVVVQGYVAPVAPSSVRPVKELKTWTKDVVAAGTTRTAELTFARDAFQHWDVATGGWLVEPGDYDIVLCASAVDERVRLRITI